METTDPAMQEAMLDEARRQNRMHDETAGLKAELASARGANLVLDERAGKLTGLVEEFLEELATDDICACPACVARRTLQIRAREYLDGYRKGME